MSNWHDREVRRLTDGTYTAIKCWPPQFTSYPDHYLHVSTKDPAQVSFTPNDEYGVKNRKMTMAPGRYLRRYFSYLAEDVISNLANHYKLIHEGKTEVHITHTPSEIARVYKDGPSSCMAGLHRSFNTGFIHPAVVYASPPIGVIYATTGKRIVARALVNTKALCIGRIYGNYDAIRQHKPTGYYIADSEILDEDEDVEYWPGFEDYKLRKVYHPWDSKFILEPYLDIGYCNWLADEDCGIITTDPEFHTHYRSSYGSIKVRNTRDTLPTCITCNRPHPLLHQRCLFCRCDDNDSIPSYITELAEEYMANLDKEDVSYE